MTKSAYRNDADMGKTLALTPLKNAEPIETGVVRPLRVILDAQCANMLDAAPICRNSLGMPYPTDNAMRKVFQDFKASAPFKTALPHSSDLTLHGLRVTASKIKEAGFDDRAIADAIGDKSKSMGNYYARGADKRKNSIRIYQKMDRK